MQSPAKAKYSQNQLSQYLKHVKLSHLDVPTAFEQAKSWSSRVQLDLLTLLLHHQLSHVPFENLDLHYAPVRGISLNPAHLFDKIVGRNSGRGGYCMQNNAFFATVLQSFGFKVYSAGARVAKSFSEPDPESDAAVNHGVKEVEYGGLSHQVNIVTLNSGARYFVDVGFGSTGPAWPVLLKDGYTRGNTGKDGNVATTLRLTRGFPSDASESARRPECALWIYSTKYGTADDESKQWIPCYCFLEQECFGEDFKIMSWYVSTNQTSIFLNSVICTKFITEGEGHDRVVVGDVTLSGDTIKERKYGKSETLAELKSEEDRTEALEKHMGIKLSQSEREGIRGLPTEIK